MPRPLICTLIAAALLAWLGLRVAANFTVAFNWDELVLLDRAGRALAQGFLDGGGHGGLSELVVAPLVAECRSEIATGRAARGIWLGISLGYLLGVGLLLSELLRGQPSRGHDVALGVASLALLPVFLEWSLQVRTDHLALTGGVLGATALLASRRRPWLAVLAGAAFALGWLASQKLAYVAALAVCLEVGRSVLTREWSPRREALRGGLLAMSVFAVTSAYRMTIEALFTLPALHPTSPVPDPELVSSYLDVFEFYRQTIGYSQYVDVLPTLAPHAAVVCLMVIASIAAARRRDLPPRLALAWGVLAAGVVVGLFHAAAFAYFWLTLGLFAALLVGLAVGPAREQIPLHWRTATATLLWGALTIPAALQAYELLEDTQAVQRESFAFVHRNFAVADPGFHPEAGLFCAPQPIAPFLSQTIYRRFGNEYAARNSELLAEEFRKGRVHFLLNSFRLNQFPIEMRRFWAENYQPYRASVFVAGRRLAGRQGESQRFELIVPGLYRWLPLRASPLVVDGWRVEPGDTVALEEDLHTASFPEDVEAGVLVLAVNDPPGPAPLAFYKRY